MTGVDLRFTVKTEAFEGWLHKVGDRFHGMVRTLIDIHSLIQANTNQLVPLDFGYLEQSYHYTLHKRTSTFFEIHSIYDAVDPDYGFHYAEYQHELERNPHPFVTYSLYSRALGGQPVGNHHRHGTRGKDHYLLDGVMKSMDDMWVMIETDYLSLFYGGL